MTDNDNWTAGWDAKHAGAIPADAVVDTQFAAGFNGAVLKFSRDDYRDTVATAVARTLNSNFIILLYCRTARTVVANLPDGF